MRHSPLADDFLEEAERDNDEKFATEILRHTYITGVLTGFLSAHNAPKDIEDLFLELTESTVPEKRN